MKNLIIFCLVFLAVVGVAWAAQDSALSIRQVRDPVQLRDKLNANALDTQTRVAAVEATSAGGTLRTAYILVGNATSNATAVAVSGAATLASTGALSTVGLTTNLTLAVTGVGGWTNVLVFTQGRLTAINP